MTMAETAEVLAVLKEYYPRDTSSTDLKAKVKAWHIILQDYPKDVIMAAVVAFASDDTKGFTPSVGQIIEKAKLLTRPTEKTGMEVWASVSRAIGNGLYGAKEEFDRLPEEAKSIIQDYHQIYQWAQMESETVNSVVQSQFIRAYETRKKTRETVASLPSAIREKIALLGDGNA